MKLNEVLKQKYDVSSVQLNIPLPIRTDIIEIAKSVPVEKLSEDGAELEPHITLRYGLLGSNESAIEALQGTGAIQCHIDKLSAFKNSIYDVIILLASGPGLHKAYEILGQKCEFQPAAYPTYVPHITLAYVKPGLADEVLSMLDVSKVVGKTFTIKTALISDVYNFKFPIQLTHPSIQNNSKL